jgi:hypothetical protein
LLVSFTSVESSRASKPVIGTRFPSSYSSKSAAVRPRTGLPARSTTVTGTSTTMTCTDSEKFCATVEKAVSTASTTHSARLFMR